MTMLVLNRNYVLSTTMGHSIAFEKGKPTFVPAAAYAAAIAVGAQPADGSDPDVLPEEVVRKYPTDPIVRNGDILTAIEQLVQTNERKDFTAAGMPAVKAVEKLVGYDVHAREVAAMWQQFHDKKAGA